MASGQHNPPSDSDNTSPPTRQGLKLWWKGFKGTKANSQQQSKGALSQPTGIFGVPLRTSILYANVQISLLDSEGKGYTYGWVPIIVAKCGVFLKEKATDVEGIFRLSGSEKRIKELKAIFDTPDRYGKGLDWEGYTVHDAANVLRRYLNELPEPIIPLNLYEKFREPLRPYHVEIMTKGEDGDIKFDLQAVIPTYQQLIQKLPDFNSQLLLYILDLLAVFSSKEKSNLMTASNLSAIFQPCILSHPDHALSPHEYSLNQHVLYYLIINQDHFLIGMPGTEADHQTVQEVQLGGTPPMASPTTPTPNRSKGAIGRSSSNASGGADSVRKSGGGVRRHASTASRTSRVSNGANSPSSPAFGTALGLTTSSGGVHRSNTVPSKRSPKIPSTRLQKASGPSTPSPASTRLGPVSSKEPQGATLVPSAVAVEREVAPASPGLSETPTGVSSLAPSSNAATAGRSQERLLAGASESNKTDAATPRDRNVSNIFQRSLTAESDKRSPNKLRKKRVASTNLSAHSSTHSLSQAEASTPVQETAKPVEHPQLDALPPAVPVMVNTGDTPPLSTTEKEVRPDASHLQTQQGGDAPYGQSTMLKPGMSAASSMHSHSTNDQSDYDHGDVAGMSGNELSDAPEKRSRWRISRRKESQTSNSTPRKNFGANYAAEGSATSITSATGRKGSASGIEHIGNTSSVTSAPVGAGAATSTNVASEAGLMSTTTNQNSSIDSSSAATTSDMGKAGKEDKEKKSAGGPIDWIKSKVREAKEEKRGRDAEKERERGASGGRKASRGDASDSEMSSGHLNRGKSMELRRKGASETQNPPSTVVHSQPPPPIQSSNAIGETQVEESPAAMAAAASATAATTGGMSASGLGGEGHATSTNPTAPA